jgi:virginiamycin A acetyltransferase
MNDPKVKTFLSQLNISYLLYLFRYLIDKKKILVVGKNTYGKPKIIWYGGNNKVIIGKFCSIAQNVTFLLTPSHNSNLISTYPFKLFYPKEMNMKNAKSHVVEKGNIVVGNDVWIGYGATIMPGITIGDGSIIAANSVVVRNVDPYSIVGGNPALFIKSRFSKQTINKLLKIKWWNWDEVKLKNNMYLLAGENINKFSKISNSLKIS